MKSVNLPTPKGNSKGGFLDNLSSSDMLKLVTASKDLISSMINAQKEISKEQEKTKQVEMQANQEMIASNNRLREKLAEFQRDITALNKMHEQEMLRLSNEHEKDMKLLEIMQGIINKIDSLNRFLICKHGEHQMVDELHAQLIHYQQALLALTSKVN
ncbi:hypothetical protein [Helicobacter pylori]|uniref:hypothetical protein n=1 Tax=Helicobacter pylori TaxID=210 RepID=UPI00123B0023|nr:hypothetical protein [Helicobacter pylori]KAA6500761.1 hypothetical protein EPC72_01325 [Helicobacter pylori]KAA6511666.1 hypothetical protein EPC74_01015 [Helicobacter pylori]